MKLFVSQHKDSLYYSESEEEGKVEEGTTKICNRKYNLDFLQTIKLYNTDHVPDDVENI